MKIDIIDIGFGNINSIKNWLEQLELEVIRVTHAENLKEELCILPGVGSAGPYMERLDALGFTEAIKHHVLKGRRLLGICLGFQILFDHSDEDGGTKLLSILQGKVERLVGNQNQRILGKRQL
jgi:glutamine amidotransferase